MDACGSPDQSNSLVTACQVTGLRFKTELTVPIMTSRSAAYFAWADAPYLAVSVVDI